MSLDREYVARQIANHGTNGVEDIEPDADDYAFADYLILNANRAHGYHTLGRRLLIAGAIAAFVIVTALIATQGAH